MEYSLCEKEDHCIGSIDWSRIQDKDCNIYTLFNIYSPYRMVFKNPASI